MEENLAAKQADTLLLAHPLGETFDNVTLGKMLDFYIPHTIKNGPAMTESIHAVVAARLGRQQQSLDLFRAAYRPFMRGPWTAFSEKRTTNNVYFLTGMGGLLQTVLYGFAGLSVHGRNEHVMGTKVAGDSEAVLVANPHLPPGWNILTIKGLRFHGFTVDVMISADNKVSVAPSGLTATAGHAAQ
jgi:trehalose/maltose hydrolase-like predicted phosphorylase